MKKILFGFLLAASLATAHAQRDCKATLDAFYLHSKNDFRDIIGKQEETNSIFYPSTLKPDIGVVKIGKLTNVTVLSWEIPLAESKEAQAAAKAFIKEKFSDGKAYKSASDGTEEEGYIVTGVYAVGAANTKPSLVFQTLYYRADGDAAKSKFTISIYGK